MDRRSGADRRWRYRAKRRSPAERQAQILEAARVLLRRRDAGEALMDELAREAGIAKGTLYLYFRSKEALFNALAVSTLEDVEKNLAQRIGAAPPEKKLAAAVKGMLEAWKIHEPVIRQIFRERPPEAGRMPPAPVADRLRRILALLTHACATCRLDGRKVAGPAPAAALFVMSVVRTILTSPLWRQALERPPGLGDIWPWLCYGLAGRRR